MENKKYSILIVAYECNIGHVSRFISNLKKTNPFVEISLCTEKKEEELTKEILDYTTNIFYINISRKSGYGRWKTLLHIWLMGMFFRKFSKNHNFDIVNIHYPTYPLAFASLYLRKISPIMITSPWGSDVLRKKGIKLKLMIRYIMRESNYITVGYNGEMGSIIRNVENIKEEHFKPLAWGSDEIDYINEHYNNLNVIDAKNKLGLTDSYIITCGYNAYPAQNHDIIIDEIFKIRNKLPENLVLLFPVTYGNSDKRFYIDTIREKCRKKKLKAIFFEDYLSVQELFVLRMATDMIVHIQPTDGGSTSLQEYVLCGKKLIHGSWIHYPSLEKFKPLFYFPVDNLSELGQAILNAYQSENIKVPQEVILHIQNRGWKAKMKLWNDFFMSQLKNK